MTKPVRPMPENDRPTFLAEIENIRQELSPIVPIRPLTKEERTSFREKIADHFNFVEELTTRRNSGSKER